MSRAFLLLLFLFIYGVMSGQVALVKDQDGYVNIRGEASVASHVKDTLHNEHLVFCFTDEEKDGWYPVDYLKEGKSFSGYLHQSRVCFLDDLPNFTTLKVNDTLLVMQYDSLRLTIRAGKFQSKGRTFTREKEQEGSSYVRFIDGKEVWGADGNIPRREYKSITLQVAAAMLTFPRAQMVDLFEPNLSYTTACVDKATGKVYISAMNSDGAGGYVVTWTIQKNDIMRRELMIPF